MSDNSAAEITEKNEDGYAWIIDGKLFVKDPVGKGIQPLLNPCEGIKLIVNGIETNHLVMVSEKDNIEIKTTDEEAEVEADVKISEDKLKAYMSFKPPRKIKRVLKDSYPVNKLDISLMEEEDFQDGYSVEQLIDIIRQQGVVYGLKEDIIRKAYKENKKGRYLIAEGKPPIDATDDNMECFLEDIEEQAINEYENIDHKELIKYKSVKPGEKIARLIRGNPGEEGISVLGETIKPKEARKIIIEASRDIQFDEESGMIRARKFGTPVKKEKGNVITYEISEKLQLVEVSLKTGNVKFKGDVEITGSVYEGMKVIANNNIFIFGDVNFSSLYSGNDIVIKGNVVTSQLVSGDDTIASKAVNTEIHRIIAEIENLIDNIKKESVSELNSQGIKGMPEIVRYMLNTKNRALPTTIYDIIHKFKKDNYDIDDSMLYTLIEKCKPFLGNYSEIYNLEYIYEMAEYLKTTFYIDEKKRVSGNILLNGAMNSEIKAIGNVVISGKTCFNTKIEAGGKVMISGNLRLGEIKAEKGIEANRVGTEIGTKIFLEVSDKGFIRMKSVYPDTTIRIGRHTYKFDSYQTGINARVVKNKLVLK